MKNKSRKHTGATKPQHSGSRAGQSAYDRYEQGQLRGVDEEGRVITGTHGGPKKKPQYVAPTR